MHVSLAHFARSRCIHPAVGRRCLRFLFRRVVVPVSMPPLGRICVSTNRERCSPPVRRGYCPLLDSGRRPCFCYRSPSRLFRFLCRYRPRELLDMYLIGLSANRPGRVDIEFDIIQRDGKSSSVVFSGDVG